MPKIARRYSMMDKDVPKPFAIRESMEMRGCRKAVKSRSEERKIT
jgi:hypothetical protein